MSQLSFLIPELGNPSKTQDPKTATAFTTILSWANGGIGEANLEEALRTALLLPNSTYRGKSIITTEETRSGTSYGLMATPDTVTVTLPENGLLRVAYQATWRESVASAARASIFVGSNQLKAASTPGAAPAVQAASIGGTPGTDTMLSSMGSGLGGVEAQVTPYTGDVSTGQVVGASSELGHYGPCVIFAAPGTYAISVQFKASSGTVTAHHRKLWVEARSF